MQSDISPPLLQHDDYSAADPARKRLNKGRKWWPWLHKAKKAAPAKDAILPTQPSFADSVGTNGSITLDKSALAEYHPHMDVYVWAVLYENQRGLMIFSLPFYSSLSLLPFDPPPFTAPSATHLQPTTSSSPTSSSSPGLSLSAYPLPSGAWRWVSSAWMLDMRTDGSLTYDGFEYNWIFKKDGWTGDVGSIIGFGKWIRRRRWVRLMMRPASIPPQKPTDNNNTTNGQSPSVDFDDFDDTDGELFRIAKEVWSGAPDPLTEWTRCKKVMRTAGRDGLRLAIWRAWLGDRVTSSKQKQPKKKWMEDEELFIGSQTDLAPRLHSLNFDEDNMNIDSNRIATVLETYGPDLLNTLVFPESRAALLQMFLRAGIMPNLEAIFGQGSNPVGEVDFWSYWNSLRRYGAGGVISRPSEAA